MIDGLRRPEAVLPGPRGPGPCAPWVFAGGLMALPAEPAELRRRCNMAETRDDLGYLGVELTVSCESWSRMGLREPLGEDS